ncbi:MAG TPA: YitT family protein [Firmicutes bacterium]|nr:YitT family protein [Bacillota bacterium]
MSRWQRIGYEYIMITIGVVLTALGYNWFLIPNKIAAGGVSGIGTVFHYLWGWPVGVVMLSLNIPLFLSVTFLLGPKFGVKSVYGAISLSLLIDLLSAVTGPVTSDPLLAAIYGGALVGIGIGITMRFQGSTGGTDLAALLINHFTHIRLGQAVLIIDACIIALAGLVFGPELGLYAFLALAVSSRAIDLVQEGTGYNKAAFIISDYPEEIAREIMYRLERGVTALRGIGMFTRSDRQVLMVIVSRREVSAVKDLVREIDPKAFLVISDVREVLGEGFRGM